MQIVDINQFLEYYSRIKERTRRLFPSIPPENMEWTYKEGKFTIGDLIRHIACIERYMYAENIQMHPSKYNGCGRNYAEGYENVTRFYEDKYKESVEIFSKLTNEDLLKKCLTPAKTEITTWKWLRAMVEHEIHHRGQLYMYLGMLGITTPPIFGLTSEEVIEKSM